MSNDYVKQLTLDCLISKSQLEKLNKRLKENSNGVVKPDKEIYKERIKLLFGDLFDRDEDFGSDLLESFDIFVNKCIQYLKKRDEEFGKKDDKLIISSENDDGTIKEDIDYDREERDVVLGNDYRNEEEDEEEEDEGDDGGEEDEGEVGEKPKQYSKKIAIDWFQRGN